MDINILSFYHLIMCKYWQTCLSLHASFHMPFTCFTCLTCVDRIICTYGTNIFLNHRTREMKRDFVKSNEVRMRSVVRNNSWSGYLSVSIFLINEIRQMNGVQNILTITLEIKFVRWDTLLVLLQLVVAEVR